MHRPSRHRLILNIYPKRHTLALSALSSENGCTQSIRLATNSAVLGFLFEGCCCRCTENRCTEHTETEKWNCVCLCEGKTVLQANSQADSCSFFVSAICVCLLERWSQSVCACLLATFYYSSLIFRCWNKHWKASEKYQRKSKRLTKAWLGRHHEAK